MDRNDYSNRVAGGVLYVRAMLAASATFVLMLITLFLFVGFLNEGDLVYALGSFVFMLLFGVACFRNFSRMREIRLDMRGE